MQWAIYFALLTNFAVIVDASRFTYLEELLQTHQRLTKDLDSYVKTEELRLAILKRYFNTFDSEHKRAMKDILTYVGNPIDAFTLIKRLTLDVFHIKTHIKEGAEFAQNLTKNHDDLKYPSSKDLLRSAEAIARFQQTQHMKQLGEGIQINLTYSSSMTASDCYELGRVLFKQQDFVNGKDWMSEALRKYDQEKDSVNPRVISAIDVIEYISLGYYELGDPISAIQWIQTIFDIDPNNSRAKQIAQDYQRRIDYENRNSPDFRCRCTIT